MTAALILQQLDGETDVDTEPAVVEPEPAEADPRQLAELLAQAYVAMPLFP